MSSAKDDWIRLISKHPEQVVIVGKSKQSDTMRSYLNRRFRLSLKSIESFTSRDAPIDKKAYILCATPTSEVILILSNRGVPMDAILIWSDLIDPLENEQLEYPCKAFGLRPLGTNYQTSLRGIAHKELIATFRQIENSLSNLYFYEEYTESDCESLQILSLHYLEIRAAISIAARVKEKKLLFPSPGRSGGTSLSTALEDHPSLFLRVNHEQFPDITYKLIALEKQGRIGCKTLSALTCFICDRYDCHGGNPFCFLMPYLKDLPWFEFYTLKVTRDEADLIDSISKRNFHYTAADFVPNRTTGWQWGDSTKETWNALSLDSKIQWYIQKVGSEIDRSKQYCDKFTVAPIESLTEGLNALLSAMQWPKLKEVPHLNTIPKGKTLPLNERAEHYRKSKAKIAQKNKQAR